MGFLDKVRARKERAIGNTPLLGHVLLEQREMDRRHRVRIVFWDLMEFSRGEGRGRLEQVKKEQRQWLRTLVFPGG